MDKKRDIRQLEQRWHKLVERQKWQQAFHLINDIVVAAPSVQNFCHRGMLLMRLGHYPEAISSFDFAREFCSCYKMA